MQEISSGEATRHPRGRLRRLRSRIGGRRMVQRIVQPDCRCRGPFGELTTEAEEVVLDVRELPMHGQIGRTLEQMEVLPDAQRLRLIDSLIPWPLFSRLDGFHHRYRVVGQKNGDFHILIWHNRAVVTS